MPPAAPPEQTQLRLRALTAALDGRDICVLHQTHDHCFDLADFLPPAWPQHKVLAMREADFMPEPIASQFGMAVNRCLELQLPQSVEFELAHADGSRTYQARILPDPDGALTILHDITEQRGRETAMASLLREVSHRSKNLLAIIQSVAMQTAHHTGGIEDFLRKFRGRLHALSSTQDLVTDSNWRGTHLHSLISAQLARVGQAASRNVQIAGENPVLGPNASLHLGLAIHELAANAVSHGSLSSGQAGAVQVNATFEHQGTARNLVIEWLETGIERNQPAGEPRFGTLVLERIVPLSVSGNAAFTIGDERVSYRLTVPAEQFEP